VVQPRRRSPTRHTSLLRLTHGCFLLSSSTQWELARFGRDLWLLEDEYGGEWRVASGEWAAEPVFSSVSMTRNESKRCTAQWVTGGNWDSRQRERDEREQNRTEQNGLLMWVPRLCDRALFVSTMESGFIASSGQLITGNILYDCLIYFLWCLGNTCDNILSYFIVIVLFLHDHILIKIMSQTSYKIFIILGSM
jgi:hypothetical protein